MKASGRTLVMSELADVVESTGVGLWSAHPVYVRLGDGQEYPVVAAEASANGITVEMDVESAQDTADRLLAFVEELADSGKTAWAKKAAALLKEMNLG